MPSLGILVSFDWIVRFDLLWRKQRTI